MLSQDRGIPLSGTKGASVHLRSFCTALAQLGVSAVIACPRPDADSYPIPTHLFCELGDLDALAAQWGAPEVVYERYSLGSVTGLEWARKRGVPYVLEVNAPLWMEAAAHRPDTVAPEHRDLERRLLQEADLVCCVSRPLKQWIAETREGPIVVTPNGFTAELENVTPVRAADGDAITLGFLGHPKPWHGARHLTPILKGVLDAGVDARLVIIGGGGRTEMLAHEASDLDLGDRLEITGAVPQSEVGRYLGRCDLTLAPHEPLTPFYFCPLKVLDSLAAGVPVIATEQGDIPDLVGPGGMCMPAGDFDLLLNAVMDLSTHAVKRHRMGVDGRAHVLERYAWRNLVDRLLSVLAQRGVT